MAVNPFRPVFAAAAAVLVAAAIAHADNPDDQFLGLLSKDGLNVGPPDKMIALAHQRCANDSLSHFSYFNLRFGGHQSPFNMAMSQLYTALQSQGLTPEQVEQFMSDAITVYCPNVTPPP